MVSDPAGMQYILNSPHFSIAPTLQTLADMLYGEKSVIGNKGTSLLHLLNWGHRPSQHRFTTGDHRRLKTALKVGFTAAAVRSYQPIFQKVAQTVSHLTQIIFVLQDPCVDHGKAGEIPCAVYQYLSTRVIFKPNKASFP
jgi:cytochrome P450